MNNFEDRFNAYIKANPRKSLQLALMAACFIWMSAVFVLGLILYLIFSRLLRLEWWLILGTGICLAAGTVMIDIYRSSGDMNIVLFMQEGFRWNVAFWKLFLTVSPSSAFSFLYNYLLGYVIGFPLLFAGMLSVTNLIQDNPHQRFIDDLQNGKLPDEKKELSERKISSALSKIDDSSTTGTILGVSTYTGKQIVIPDHFVNQIALVLGTTGGGKTITLRRFYKRSILQGYPLIVVDGKPTDDNVKWLRELAEKNNRPFYGFNCETFSHYDQLANGGYSELKDKIISLKDKWESDYYRSIAESYLQTTFEVLQATGKPFDLKRVVDCLNYEELQADVYALNNDRLSKRVAKLESYDQKDIKGLEAHLSLLIDSELGEYFDVDENTITIPKAIEENAVVYFALPALRFPSFSKVLGKLVINDIKSTIDRNNESNKRIFMIFDEFSVFAGEQVLNLVNMGRGKGVHAVFGTQGLADLNRVDADFKNQVLNCTNTIICHRINDQDSAESVSNWIGTKTAFTVSAQYNPNQKDKGVGTIGHTKEFIVHPDDIKQKLKTGEAYCVSKVENFGWEKVRVLYQ